MILVLQGHEATKMLPDRGHLGIQALHPLAHFRHLAADGAQVFEHEATTSKISEDQLFYCLQRGLSAEEATALIVNGFVKDVLQKLPMEFAVEAQKLIAISLEGSVG